MRSKDSKWAYLPVINRTALWVHYVCSISGPADRTAYLASPRISVRRTACPFPRRETCQNCWFPGQDALPEQSLGPLREKIKGTLETNVRLYEKLSNQQLDFRLILDPRCLLHMICCEGTWTKKGGRKRDEGEVEGGKKECYESVLKFCYSLLLLTRLSLSILKIFSAGMAHQCLRGYLIMA